MADRGGTVAHRELHTERPLTIVMAHNRYQRRGGEDQSFEAETLLLEEAGHRVVPYVVTNDSISDTQAATAGTALRAVWNPESAGRFRRLVGAVQPDVVHFQNFFPLISPAAHHVAAAMGVAVVQSVRNYRLLCPTATFFRDGQVCEDCVGRAVPWPGVLHACYRESRAASASVAAMIAVHRARGTWEKDVDLFVALTDFVRAKVLESMPGLAITVKPNFVHPDPGVATGRREGAVFVGRLSAEKGVMTLLDAWDGLPDHPLRIVGSGPMEDEVRERTDAMPHVQLVGRLSREETDDEIGRAALLVFPSEWYETFGRVAIEAYARGTPVLAADIGAVAEVAGNDAIARRYRAGDANALRRAAAEMLGDPDGLARMGAAAREAFVATYTGPANLVLLEAVYAEAMGRRDRRVAACGESATPRPRQRQR